MSIKAVSRMLMILSPDVRVRTLINEGTKFPKNLGGNRRDVKPMQNYLNNFFDPQQKLKHAEEVALKVEHYKSIFTNEDEKYPLKTLFSTLWYTYLPCYDVEGVTSSKGALPQPTHLFTLTNCAF